MSDFPAIKCKNCGKTFETQIKIDPAIYAMYPNLAVGQNTFTCPHCEKQETYTEKDFEYTQKQANTLANFGKIVKAFVEVVEASSEPLKTATDILGDLENAKQKGDVAELKKSKLYSAFKKWIPDSPEKLAAYIVIIQVIINSLTNEPDKPLEQTTIINNIDQTVIMQIDDRQEKKSIELKKEKTGRNKPCPCGSGKKYKHCHGRLI